MKTSLKNSGSHLAVGHQCHSKSLPGSLLKKYNIIFTFVLILTGTGYGQEGINGNLVSVEWC
ncbi:MAG TPA: hypothetical protein VLB50_13785, partial [Ignavibacteriaceae bacterium]|nr:hypothetical protein [Ignavibacteriaceae bacterium]